MKIPRPSIRSSHPLRVAALSIITLTWAGLSTCRAQHAGSVDTSFSVQLPATFTNISSFVEPDGKIILGGYDSSTVSFAVSFLRLNANGSIDSTFNSPAGKIEVFYPTQVFALQSDGRILVTGQTGPATVPTTNILARLNTDGSVDSTFNVTLPFSATAMVIQPDGKILVGGNLPETGSDLIFGVSRYNSDGTLDASFHLDSSFQPENIQLDNIIVQPDGKIITAGIEVPHVDVALVGIVPQSGVYRLHGSLARFNSDGSLDATFDPGILTDLSMGAVVLQTDGKILVNAPLGAGTSLIRLNADGTPDETFYSPLTSVSGLALQQDGKILAAAREDVDGQYFPAATSTGAHVLRLETDGSLDPSFQDATGPNNSYSLGLYLESNGELLVGLSALLYTTPPMPPFFNQQTSLANDFYEIDTFPIDFGPYYLGLFPYVFDDDLGTLYCIDAQNSARGAYFYDYAGLGWLYIEPQSNAYLYDFNLQAFLYHLPDPANPQQFSRNPRMFLNLATGLLISQ